MKNSFWLLLILAMGTPTASMANHRLTSDPYLLVTLSPGDPHTAYDPSKPLLSRLDNYPLFGSSALLVHEGSRLVNTRYPYRVHFGTAEERHDLAAARAAAGYPWGERAIHEFTVEVPSFLTVPGSVGVFGSQYRSVYFNINGVWTHLRPPVQSYKAEPGVYLTTLSTRSLDPFLENSRLLRTGYTRTNFYILGRYKKTEEQISAKIQIELRNGPHHENIILDYATQDNTAKAGEDYVETRDTLFIPAGTTNFIQTISVPILDDEIDEEEGRVL